jgi:hypothetical protein
MTEYLATVRSHPFLSVPRKVNTMTATGQPTLEMLPNMQSVAATIAKDASENLAGVDVVSVSPLFWVAPNTAYG